MSGSERWQEAIRRLSVANEVCVDVETSGLDWRHNHIVGYVLTFGPAPQDSYYLSVRHVTGNIPGCEAPQTKDGWMGDLHPIERELKLRFERPALTMFGHNFAFDLKFMMRTCLGNLTAKYEDTIINAPLLNEWMSSFSLDNCAREAKVAAKKVTIYEHLQSKFPEAVGKSAMGHFWRLAGDDPVAVEYAEGDGTTTWQLRDWQHERLRVQELERVHAVECKVLPILVRMSCRGIKIDVERLQEVRQIVRTKRDEALNSLPSGFNSRAPTQVRALMEQHGHTDWPLTPKGAPSFPEQWLVTNPVGGRIVAVRKFDNLENSFLGPMVDTHLWNGRCHPEYNQLRGDEYGTVTGRLSSSNPNLQQVNKRNFELSMLHRSIFTSDEGMTWCTSDYKQCEPVLLAYYSRSKVLVNGYRAVPPLDAHTAVTRATNADYDTLTDAEKKARRETGKRVNQTLITGGGKKVLVSKYGVDPARVDQIWADYFEAMPEIKSLQQRAARTMENRGYVVSLLGRRARLNDSSKSYVAVNRLLQCGNADILKQKLIEVDSFYQSEGGRVHVLNNVHDSLDYQFHEDDRKIVEEGLNIMSRFGPDDAIHLDIPLGVDVGYGKNWAEATWSGK